MFSIGIIKSKWQSTLTSVEDALCSANIQPPFGSLCKHKQVLQSSTMKTLCFSLVSNSTYTKEFS